MPAVSVGNTEMNLKFNNEHLDTFGRPAQHNYVLIAKNASNLSVVVGTIHYAILSGNDKTVFVDLAIVREDLQKRGIGTKMVKHLMTLYPGRKLDWGMCTAAGEKLRKKFANPVSRRRRYKKPQWADEFKTAGHKIDSDGTIVVYHATTAAKAKKILKEGVLRRPPDAPDSYGVYFSISPEVAEDYGDGTLVMLRVHVEDLFFDDYFPSGRMDFHAKTRGGIYRPVEILPFFREAS